jgi:hypothetical protein
MEDGFSGPSRPNQQKAKLTRQKRLKTIQPLALKRLIEDLKNLPSRFPNPDRFPQ